MPFVPGTPESRLQRSDSKDPATTCKGLTSEGKHCRRDIAAPATRSRFRRKKKQTYNYNNDDDDDDDDEGGVVAVLDPEDSDHDGAAAYFCWQHKDQAATLTASTTAVGRKSKIVPLRNRSSVDTLAERLGIVNIDEEDDEEPIVQLTRRRKKKQNTNPRPARKETLPQQWQNMNGPLLAVGPQRPPGPTQRKQKRVFCCLTAEYEEPVPASKPMPAAAVTPMSQRPQRVSAMPIDPHTPNFSHRPSGYHHSPSPHARPSNPSTPSSRPPQKPTTSPFTTPNPPFLQPQNRRRSSHTQTLMSWIPPSVSPTTASALLAELAKPVSQQDEAGYIYIFWLNDASSSSRSGLSSPSSKGFNPATMFLGDQYDNDDGGATARGGGGGGGGGRRRSSQAVGSTPPSTVTLKIGRANNVQRRMQQWNRQCGYNLDVVRCYPYLPPTSPPPQQHHRPSSSQQQPTPTTVPFSHKVERLIHIELGEFMVKKDCEACGTRHREWFEFEATREGIEGVDGVCRRWCDWAGSLRGGLD